MRIPTRYPAVLVAVAAVAIGATIGAVVLKPAIAADGAIRIGPYALVTCSQQAPNPCQEYKNKNTGVGLLGVAATGTGVQGSSTSMIGVAGYAPHGTGVFGQSTDNTGVEGVSTSWYGLSGSSSSNFGIYGASNSNGGIYGYSSTGAGIEAFSDGTAALYADARTGYSVEAHGEGGQPAVYGSSNGTGAGGWFDSRATGNTNYGIVVYSQGNPAIVADNQNGVGADINGSLMGVVGRAPAASVGTYPFIATDESNNSLFWVTGGGAVYAHGYNTFTATRGGYATAYGTVATSPTIEDNGTAQLIDGVATVALDPAFAKTIDPSRSYQVMLTPDGDTRGLFVASKSMNGFVVREIQGGRSSIAFDYHIYAPVLGQAQVRMRLLDHVSGMPRAPMSHPGSMRPTRLAPVPIARPRD